MNKTQQAYQEIKRIDEMADGNSVVHHFSPLSKLIVTLCYITTLMSFPKYSLSNVISMCIYPLLMYPLANISIYKAIWKMKVIIPLILLIGILNPFFDNTLIQIGTITINGGWISFITLAIKGILALLATYLLVATTRIDSICHSLRKLHIPSYLVSLILLTYRYVSVMVEELSTMSIAYQLRAPKEKGIAYQAWGSFLGNLLLRSMDKAKEIYLAMKLRGYKGDYYIENNYKKSPLFFISWIMIFIILRFLPVVEWIGRLFI